MDRAYYWLERAVENGDPQAIKTANEMEEFVFTWEELNGLLELPIKMNFPLRRRTLWKLKAMQEPFYEDLLRDLKGYMAIHPIEGYEFIELLLMLEEKVAG